MNFIHVVGRLGRDPESRMTPSGQKVTNLSVAESYKKGGNEVTIWYRVALWGDRWDKMLPYFTKGKPIMFGGKMMKPELYTDKSGNTQISSIDVNADFIDFLPYGKTEDQEGSTAPNMAQSGGMSGQMKAAEVAANEMVDEESMPF